MYYVKTQMGAYNSIDSENHFNQVRKIAKDTSQILEIFIYDNENRKWIKVERF